jgi:hypothetical protein
VIVNLSDAPAHGHVRVPWEEMAGRSWQLDDRLGGHGFQRGGDELTADGLYVALEPWAFHFLAFSPAPAEARAALTGADTLAA